MYRSGRNIALILLVFLSVSGARAACLSETVRLAWPTKQPEMSSNLGQSRDATRESTIQGRQTRLVKPFAPSPVVFCALELAVSGGQLSVQLHLRTYFFGSSYYFSSRCNKAPPAA
jgi:hypothetical protein